jgi:hypothetical protein
VGFDSFQVGHDQPCPLERELSRHERVASLVAGAGQAARLAEAVLRVVVAVVTV